MLTSLVAFASLLWSLVSWVRMDAAFRARDAAVEQLREESARRTEMEKREVGYVRPSDHSSTSTL